MSNSDEMLFCAGKVTDMLVQGVTHQVKYTKPELVVTEDTLLKAEAEMDVFDFGDLLLQLFNKTKWIMGYQVLIDWFAQKDCTIKELSGKIEYVKTHYPFI